MLLLSGGQSDHHHDTCRFKSSTCHYCGKLGHIQTVCRSRRSFSTRDTSNRPFVDSSSRPSYRSSDSDSSRHSRHPIRSSHPRSSHVKQVVGNNDEPDNTEEYSLFNLPSGSCAPLVVTILIDHTSLSMEVDTGASFSVVSKNTYEKFFSSRTLQRSTVKLKTYTGETLPVFGQITANVQYRNQDLNLLLIIAGNDGPSLLGRNWIHLLRLDWSSVLYINNHSLPELLEEYSAVFNEGLGTLKGFKAKLYVNQDAPIFCKARPVPYAIRTQVETELQKLQQLGIIDPIPFSEWAAPIVPVLKADKKSIRICGDFKQTSTVFQSWIDTQFPKWRICLPLCLEECCFQK